MSVYYRNRYWLLGDGADKEAQRWIADDKHKKLVYSSPRAVEMEEIGNHLSPELPIPPKGFVVVVIGEIDVDGYGPMLGVADWCGNGGWVERKDNRQKDANPPATAEGELDARRNRLDTLLNELFLFLRDVWDQPRSVARRYLFDTCHQIIDEATGGSIEPKELSSDQPEMPDKTESIRSDTPEKAPNMDNQRMSEKDFLEELKRMSDEP